MIKFKISDFLLVDRLFHWRRLLWKSQYYPAPELEALQWRLLSGLLDHCFAEVPFYREQLRRLGLSRADFNSIGDLSKLPVIRKSDLFERGESFKAEGFEKYRPKQVRTTGTTVSPMRIYWDAASNVIELVSHWRHYSWFNYRLGTPFMDIRDYRQHMTGQWRWNWKCRGLETSIRFWNASNAAECFRMLKKRGIRLWRGHGAALYQLCRCFDEAGIPEAKPDCIIPVGSALLAYERSFMEKWAGIPIGDSYGLTEHTALICQCPEGGYHIASEYGIVELLREDGTPVAPGEEGRIVSTGLHNRAFPLLRYDTGDYAVRSGRACACGRTLPLVEELTGRNDDRLVDKRGRRVVSLHRLFRYADGVRTAQIVQTEAGAIDVYIVPAGGFDAAARGRLAAEFDRELRDDMEVRIHIVKDLPFPSPKKFKFVVNRLKDLREK
jgi:phenylacetate-CoA ligase